MTRELLTLEAKDLLVDAINTFNNHNIRHAPVVSRGELVGMLSWIDIKKLAAPSRLEASDGDTTVKVSRKIMVRNVMTHDPVTVQLDDSIRELGEILTENDFHAVPVLDGERVVGIVSTTDLIRFFLDSVD